MQEAGRPIDLIISLARDVVGLAMPTPEGTAWRSTFPVSGLFQPEVIARVFDQALEEHPVLFTETEQVDVLLVDSPHTVVPAFLDSDSWRRNLLSRYLRIHFGDRVQTEFWNERQSLGYTLPEAALTLVREYFSGVRIIHLSTILAHAVTHTAGHDTSGGTSMWVTPYGVHVHILMTRDKRVVFTNTYACPNEADLVYFVTACRQWLRPATVIWSSFADQSGEVSLPAGLADIGMLTQSWPSLRQLIDAYRTCAL